MTDTDPEFYAELEATGEDKVRSNLALGVYNSRKVNKIKDWLRRKDQARLDAAEARTDASSREQIDIARSAKNAAWVAAIAAIIAAICASAAVVINPPWASAPPVSPPASSSQH